MRCLERILHFVAAMLCIAIIRGESLYGEIAAIPEDVSSGINQQDIDQADIIVVATLKKENDGFFETSSKGEVATPQGPVPGEVFKSQLDVISAVKGNPPKVIDARFYVPDSIFSFQQWTIALGRPVLFLLKYNASDNVYELERQPYSWMTLSNDVLLGGSEMPTDYVRKLVTNILESGFSAPTAAQLSELQMPNGDSKALDQYYGQESNFGILQALRTVASLQLDSPGIRDALHKWWSSNNEGIQIKSLEISLSLHDPSAIVYCIQNATNAPDGSTLRLNLQHVLVLSVNRVQSNDLTALKPYIGCELPEVRSAALLHLQNVKNPTFLPVFVSFLNDPDSTVEYHAMLGIYYLDPDLIKIEKLPVPGIKLFKMQPQYYSAMWNKWLVDGGLVKLQADLNLK
jgi:hypothetical protein